MAAPESTPLASPTATAASPAATADRRSLPGPAQLALGAELRRLRTSQRGPDGRPLTQATVAGWLFVGGKPAVSLLESGRRLPDEKTVERYVEALAGDADLLTRLRAAALVERAASRQPPQPGPASAPPGTPEVVPEPAAGTEPTVDGSGRSRRRWWTAGIAAAVLVAGGITAAALALDRPPAPGGRILEPVGTVALPSPLHGTVSGYAGDDLWIDVQALAEPRHHPMNTPCAREGDVFACDPLYAGRPSDTGVTFRLTLLATPRGGAADAALLAYGARDTTEPDGYLGLTALPAGTAVVTSALVTRN